MASHCFCNTLGLLDTFINQSQFSALSSTHRPRQVYTASHNRSDTCLYSGGCYCWYKTVLSSYCVAAVVAWQRPIYYTCRTLNYTSRRCWAMSRQRHLLCASL